MMVILSLLLNVAVLAPVCAGLLRDAAWARAAYGQDTPARRILLSVYLAIGLASVVLLARHDPSAVAALLAVQVAYKLTTPLTVGTLANPVVLSNLGIAAFHLATLASLAWGGALGHSADGGAVQ
ncbi:MAG: hypothetical protein U0800_06515 [Isosphaeraceae bacterium]